jgi:hypothetical protein
VAVVRRLRIAAVLAAPVLLAAGCGGGTKTVVINNSTTKTVIVPAGGTAGTTATGATTTPRTTSSTKFRKPSPGEGVINVTGVVTDGQVRIVSGAPTDQSQYIYLVVHPDQGLPLRIGAAGDLQLTVRARDAISDPACSGTVRGVFRVAAAPYQQAFDFALISARIVRDNCH